MRIFDTIGIAVVAIWLGIIALTAWDNFSRFSGDDQARSDQVVLNEGESWMILRHNENDIGYLHEVRTRIESGWLLETQTQQTISTPDGEQTITSNIKASVDNHAILRTFSGEFTVQGNAFRTLGEVGDKVLNITIYAGNTQTSRTIELTEPPRLLTTAYNRILALPDLAEGSRIQESFFEPLSMAMTQLTLEYAGTTQTEVWDEQYTAHRFIQPTEGTEYYTLIDQQGDVLIQMFPLDVVGSRVPTAIGRAQAMTLRSQLQKNRPNRGKSRSGEPFDLEKTLHLLARMTGTAPRDAELSEQAQKAETNAESNNSSDL